MFWTGEEISVLLMYGVLNNRDIFAICHVRVYKHPPSPHPPPPLQLNSIMMNSFMKISHHLLHFSFLHFVFSASSISTFSCRSSCRDSSLGDGECFPSLSLGMNLFICSPVYNYKLFLLFFLFHLLLIFISFVSRLLLLSCRQFFFSFLACIFVF